MQERDLNSDSDFGDTNEVVYYQANTLFSVYALSDGDGAATVLDADGGADADGLSDVKHPACERTGQMGREPKGRGPGVDSGRMANCRRTRKGPAERVHRALTALRLRYPIVQPFTTAAGDVLLSRADSAASTCA